MASRCVVAFLLSCLFFFVSFLFFLLLQALTEGFGPLVFGVLMALFERTPVPGAPYLLACVLSMWAFLHCFELPPEPEVAVAKHRAATAASGAGAGLDEDHEGTELLAAYKQGGGRSGGFLDRLRRLASDSSDLYDYEGAVAVTTADAELAASAVASLMSGTSDLRL